MVYINIFQIFSVSSGFNVGHIVTSHGFWPLNQPHRTKRTCGAFLLGVPAFYGVFQAARGVDDGDGAVHHGALDVDGETSRDPISSFNNEILIVM